VPSKSRWTPVSVIVDAFGAVKRFPLDVVLGLIFVPAVWGLPPFFFVKYKSLLGLADLGGLPAIVCMRALGMLAGAAWQAVIQAGLIRIALSTADGVRPDLHDFFRGPRLYAQLFLFEIGLALVSLVESLGFPRAHHPSAPAIHSSLPLTLAAFALGMYLQARFVFWPFFIVDARASFRVGLRESWHRTHDRVAALIRFKLLTMLPLLLLVGIVYVRAFAKARLELPEGFGPNLSLYLITHVFFAPTMLADSVGVACIYRAETTSAAIPSTA
jgi:hypothetical protein